MIIIAALYIIKESIDKWRNGLHLENIERGAGFVVLATAINGALGWYLIRQGKNITPLSLKPMVKMLHFKCLKFSGISLPKVRIGNSCVNDEKMIQNDPELKSTGEKEGNYGGNKNDPRKRG